MNTVKELINEIHSNLSQTSSSQRDETRVMQAMLSDPFYTVDVYGGKDESPISYNPTMDFRNMCASVMSNTAKIPMAEAEQLIDAMIRVSKEFVNTYLQTGRKLPLGARETSDVSISAKHIPAATRTYPMKVGVNEDGTDRYVKEPTTIPAHDSLRVSAPCPSWVK